SIPETPDYSRIPQASPPTFLFLLIFNCQKTDTNQVSKNQTPQVNLDPRETSISSSFPIFSRTKDFVASSAAALVSERTYKRTPPNKSTHVFHKSVVFP
ncbi:hypothetical protein, partial [uncultured Agrobacterium sp.]|uniref:hypothetical protein n=1 Tax=uncultured Agrobacterium sp. TaxID=157277 RepID=UPI0025DDF0AD